MRRDFSGNIWGMLQSRRAAQIIAIYNLILPGTAYLPLFVWLSLVKSK